MTDLDARVAGLLPCPFCGHETPEFERMGTSSHSCIVNCGNCGCSHESGDEYLQSGQSWNRRAELQKSALQVNAADAEPLCHVVGFPEAGRKVCQLHKGHAGYHQDGSVRWLGYFPAPSQPAAPKVMSIDGRAIYTSEAEFEEAGNGPAWLSAYAAETENRTAAPVELPVVTPIGEVSSILGDICTIQLKGYSVRKGDKLVKLSDAQAAIAAGRKAS